MSIEKKEFQSIYNFSSCCDQKFGTHICSRFLHLRTFRRSRRVRKNMGCTSRTWYQCGKASSCTRTPLSSEKQIINLSAKSKEISDLTRHLLKLKWPILASRMPHQVATGQQSSAVHEVIYFLQECIPVGCVPPASVVISGGVCPGGVSARGGVCRGVSAQGCVLRGCLYTPHTQRQTPLDTEACPLHAGIHPPVNRIRQV